MGQPLYPTICCFYSCLWMSFCILGFDVGNTEGGASHRVFAEHMYFKAQLYAHMQPAHVAVGSWVYGHGEVDDNYNTSCREGASKEGGRGGKAGVLEYARSNILAGELYLSTLLMGALRNSDPIIYNL
jgi:hypothetical protein